MKLSKCLSIYLLGEQPLHKEFYWASYDETFHSFMYFLFLFLKSCASEYWIFIFHLFLLQNSLWNFIMFFVTWNLMHNTVEMMMCYEVGVWGYLITSLMSNLKGEPAMPGGAGNSQSTNKPPQEVSTHCGNLVSSVEFIVLVCSCWSSYVVAPTSREAKGFLAMARLKIIMMNCVLPGDRRRSMYSWVV